MKESGFPHPSMNSLLNMEMYRNCNMAIVQKLVVMLNVSFILTKQDFPRNSVLFIASNLSYMAKSVHHMGPVDCFKKLNLKYLGL